MSSEILAFRPASVVERLDPRSRACPLSTRDLLAPAAEAGLVLPLVQAPVLAVARGALVAAKELQGALGLGMPQGTIPEAWFDAVAKAADEVAGGLPIFLSAEVVVAGEGATQVERAFHEAWRLVGAGITHLAIDVAAVAPGERGRVVGEVAEAGVEHGICVDVVVPLSDGAQAGARAAAIFEELERRGAPGDLASVRCPAPASGDEARLQAGALARISQALAGVPVARRGPTTPELVGLLRESPVKVCEDGGVASARAVAVIPWASVPSPGEEQEARGSALERAASELGEDAIERMEARAYVDVVDFMERLGARGSAPAISRAIVRQRERA